MEIPSELISVIISAIVALITAFTTNEYWKRKSAKLEYFKNRFGPFYHVCVDTLDSLELINNWLKGQKWGDATVWEYLLRFHSYQWTLKADHLPDMNYLVSKKWLSASDTQKLKKVMDDFDEPFHRLLSKEIRFPEQDSVKIEELRFGKVYIRQIKRPDLKKSAIKNLKKELMLKWKDTDEAIEILEKVINLLAKKI